MTFGLGFVYLSEIAFDVTSKVGDQIKIDEVLVHLRQHQNRKKVSSTIMETLIFSSLLCSFAKY